MEKEIFLTKLNGGNQSYKSIIWSDSQAEVASAHFLLKQIRGDIEQHDIQTIRTLENKKLLHTQAELKWEKVEVLLER